MAKNYSGSDSKRFYELAAEKTNESLAIIEGQAAEQIKNLLKKRATELFGDVAFGVINNFPKMTFLHNHGSEYIEIEAEGIEVASSSHSIENDYSYIMDAHFLDEHPLWHWGEKYKDTESSSRVYDIPYFLILLPGGLLYTYKVSFIDYEPVIDSQEEAEFRL